MPTIIGCEGPVAILHGMTEPMYRVSDRLRTSFNSALCDGGTMLSVLKCRVHWDSKVIGCNSDSADTDEPENDDGRERYGA